MSAPIDAPDVSDAVPARASRPLAEVATGIGWDDRPPRDLDRAELLDLAASIARDRPSWSEHVAFSEGDRRHYVNLYRDAHIDVWLLCWTPTDDTGWHDHDVSAGAVAVAQGRLVEHNLAVGDTGVTTEIPAGLGYDFGPDHIHRLTGAAGVPGGSVSVHAYSPPLWRMGQYAVGANGMLRRTSVSYADELRPLDGRPGGPSGSPA
jgi:cysteine dioxygenase type I